MPRETLLALTNDVTRLLAAGGSSAPGDDGLRKRSLRLRELGKQVAALIPIADAVDKVLSASPKQANAALLDLAVVARQVRGSLTTAGLSGEMKSFSGEANWATPLSIRDLNGLMECLDRSDPYNYAGVPNKLERVKSTFEGGKLADLRLVGPMIGVLGGGNSDLADYLATTVLPSFGRSVLPDLERGLDLKGKIGDARRLLAICAIDSKRGAELCRQALAEGSESVQTRALECLGSIDPKSAEQVALKMIVEGKSGIRAACCRALRNVVTDNVLNAITACVEDGSEVWQAAQKVLTTYKHPKTTEHLLNLLNAAIKGWENVPAAKKKPAPAAAPKGKKKPARDPNEILRESLQEQMSRLASVLCLRPDVAKAVDSLVTLSRHPHADTRVVAANALGQAGPVSNNVVPALVELLNDKLNAVQSAAVDALNKIGPPAKAAVPELLKLADRPKIEKSLQVECIVTANRLEPNDGNARAKVMEVLTAKKTDVGECLLNRIENDDRYEFLLPLLIDALKQNFVPFDKSYFSFESLDPDGTTAIPQLMAVGKNTKIDSKTRCYALDELERYGEKIQHLVPDFIALLDDPNESVRGEAIDLLEVAGLSSVSALPKLLGMFQAGKDPLRLWSAFLDIDPDGATVIPFMIDQLKSKKDDARYAAVMALGWYGKKAPAAVEPIRALLKDKIKRIREEAKDALERIQ
jgi:HEAT repeat protein